MTIEKRFQADVLVAGGGVAGVSAALTTARSGLNTLLIESQSSLGGLATNGYVNGVAGMVEGNCAEWLDRMEAAGALLRRPHQSAIDPEKGKLVLEAMLLEAGARILYGATITEVVTQDSMIKEVICQTKSGRTAVSARIVIDATGDADVAVAAGVPCEVGSAEFGGINMSTTMAFRLANVDMPKYQAASRDWMRKETTGGRERTQMGLYSELEDKAVAAGDLPRFVFPTALIYPVPGTPPENADVCVMTTHSFNARNTDVEDLSRQIIEQHEQIGWMERFYRKYLPGFEQCRLTGIANLHGVRDSRRIVGEYVLRDEDVVCAAKFGDGIARFPEFFDTHHPTDARLGFIRHVHLSEPREPAVCRPAQCGVEMHPAGSPGGYEARVNPLDYCEIPYRSLVPRRVDNLFVAGRCMSAEFNAIAAVRVIATSMTTGQAAATAAKVCMDEGLTPRQVDGKRVRELMIARGVPLDEAPGGHWATVRQELRGEFVVVPGDFVGVMTKEGLKTHM